MAYSTHNWPNVWQGLHFAVFVEGGGRWEFATQDEAHAFIQSIEAYDPDAEVYWEVFKND